MCLPMRTQSAVVGVHVSTDEDPEIIRGNREQLVETHQRSSEPIRAH